MLNHEGMGILGHAGDFSQSEVLVATVIVKGDHGGQFALCSGRFQDEGFGWRAKGKLPLQMLDVESIELQLMLNGGGGSEGDGGSGSPPPAAAGAGLSGAEVQQILTLVINSLYANWLGCRPSVHEVELTGPTDYTSIFQACDGVFRSLWPRWLRSISNTQTPGLGRS